MITIEKNSQHKNVSKNDYSRKVLEKYVRQVFSSLTEILSIHLLILTDVNMAI